MLHSSQSGGLEFPTANVIDKQRQENVWLWQTADSLASVHTIELTPYIFKPQRGEKPMHEVTDAIIKFS